MEYNVRKIATDGEDLHGRHGSVGNTFA